MKPDIYINPTQGPRGCRADPNGASKLCLPVSVTDVNAFVHAFIASVHSIRQAHPRVTIFEPMNEPWNWPYHREPRRAARRPPNTPRCSPACCPPSAPRGFR